MKWSTLKSSLFFAIFFLVPFMAMAQSQYGSLFIIAVTSAFLAFGSSANAQTAVSQKVEASLAAASAKLQAACGGDLSKYCITVTPGEGRLIFCMMAHEDKLSSKCDYALYDASRKMERMLDLIEQAADACWNDIEKHCAKVPEGGGRVLSAYSITKRRLQRHAGPQLKSSLQ